MPSLSGSVQVFGQELWSSSSTPAHQVGAIGLGSNGRVFRYAKAGVVDLVVGNALQARADPENYLIAVRTNTAAGATSLPITAGANPFVANEYAGGFVVVESDPGGGYTYTIAGHAAIAQAGNGVLDLQDAVQVALTTASRLQLVNHPYHGVIQHPVTAGTGKCAGGCVYPILANQYGWVQTGGPGAALIAGTPAIGQPLTSTGTPAGSLSVHSAELNIVAEMMVAGRTGKIQPVWWLID